MPETCSTDQKLDQTVAMLKWVLAGIGTALASIAVFLGSWFKDNDHWMKEQIVTVLTEQTKILKEIRDDQKKFPAVAAKPDP